MNLPKRLDRLDISFSCYRKLGYISSSPWPNMAGDVYHLVYR